MTEDVMTLRALVEKVRRNSKISRPMRMKKK